MLFIKLNPKNYMRKQGYKILSSITIMNGLITKYKRLFTT